MNLATDSEIISQKVLRSSIIFTATFTIIALSIGFLTGSQVILFDGVFSLIGVALTYLSIMSLKFIQKRDTWNYPFGKVAFEPFVAIVQYSIVLYICITNIATAIGVILNGGHAIDITSGILYGVFSAVFNFVVFTYLRRLTKEHVTAISKVELDQWKFSLLLGVGILVGFSISFGLTLTAYRDFTAFVDPILTIIITILFGRTAIISMKTCVKELMQGAPSPEMFTFVKSKIKEIKQHYNLSEHILRLGKVGSQLIIEIDFVIECQSELDSVLRQDEVRKKLADDFEELPYEKWININFTGDKSLVE